MDGFLVVCAQRPVIDDDRSIFGRDCDLSRTRRGFGLVLPAPGLGHAPAMAFARAYASIFPMRSGLRPAPAASPGAPGWTAETESRRKHGYASVIWRPILCEGCQCLGSNYGNEGPATPQARAAGPRRVVSDNRLARGWDAATPRRSRRAHAWAVGQRSASGRSSFATLPDNLCRPNGPSTTHATSIASRPVQEGSRRPSVTGIVRWRKFRLTTLTSPDSPARDEGCVVWRYTKNPARFHEITEVTAFHGRNTEKPKKKRRSIASPNGQLRIRC